MDNASGKSFEQEFMDSLNDSAPLVQPQDNNHERKQRIWTVVAFVLIALVILGAIVAIFVNRRADSGQTVESDDIEALEDGDEFSLPTESVFDDLYEKLEDEEISQKETIDKYFDEKISALTANDAKKNEYLAAKATILANYDEFEAARDLVNILWADETNLSIDAKNYLCGATFVLSSQSRDDGLYDFYEGKCLVSDSGEVGDE